MKMSVFKRHLRPVLISILGDLNNQQLVQRYYKAALSIVRKRRANHIQSWRVHKKHKELIYDRNYVRVRVSVKKENVSRPKKAEKKINVHQSTSALISPTTKIL